MNYDPNKTCTTCAEANTSDTVEPCAECRRIENETKKPFTKWQKKGKPT